MSEQKKGKWVPSDTGGRVWVGPQWPPEKHGPAVIHYGCDKPHDIENCLLEDGSRGPVWRRCNRDNPDWRRRLGDGSYVYGDIEIREDDVIFRKTEFLPIREIPDGELPNLERDLLRSARIRGLAEDRGYAVKIYQALCNNRWLDKDFPQYGWSCSCRYAGGVVAGLRDKGEEYIDFYLSHPEGVIDDNVRAEFFALGWIEDETYD